MNSPALSDLRNVVFCGHGSAGKSTLVDRLLATAGAASVGQNGDRICDSDELEKRHGHSIESAVTRCQFAGKRFTLIDTPGYPEFIGQTVAALRAVEMACICVHAGDGIQVNTRRTFAEATEAGVGRGIVVTRLDDPKADFGTLLHDMQELWGPAVVAFNVPLGQGDSLRGVASALDLPIEARDAAINLAHAHERLVERIVETDEALMEKYFEGEMPDAATLAALLHKAVAKGLFIPVFCTAATGSIGLSELLEGLAIAAPAPCDLPRFAKQEGEALEVGCDADGPLVAQVFKTRIDPFVQKLSYLRIYSGRLSKDQAVHVQGVRKDVKMHPLYRCQGNEIETVDSAGAGEIVATAKMDELHIGTSLGEAVMAPISFPQPMVGLAVTSKMRGDEQKLALSLQKLVEEDPTFRLSRDSQTSELVMNGMSDLHLQLLRERLATRDKLEVDTHDPKIPYRETIASAAEGSYRHKKQSGGRGQFAEVHIRVLPMPHDVDIEQFATKSQFPSMRDYHYDPSCHFLWVDSIVGATIPGNFMPAVEKGLKDRLGKGVLAGYHLQDLAVEVHFGKHHPVDSSEAAFRIAASLALRDVAQKAGPSLLEPLVTMEITVPDEHVGDVYSDMSSRGGRVLGSESAGGGQQTVSCQVPLRCVSHYDRTLSSMTGGQGSYSMDFSHYESVPANIQHEIVASAKLAEEED
ncbi:elongation factor G [Roseimaritima sediminicola]|uniref:elongation factor G n=1 Tax=Roseimaritima sediminicola TaxID=2662066 RepID=UPI0012982F4C|nr:elongation factor G [Roseimaritima sediminicola]